MRPAGVCGHEATDLRSLVPAPIRVLMITSGYPQPGQPHTHEFVKRQAEFLRAAGVEVEVFDFRGRQKLRHYVTGWARVRSRLGAGRYDLVHAQFGQSGLLALPKRLPLVVTLRGDDLQGIVDDVDGRIGLKGKVLQRISQWVASHADSVIVVSEHMRAFLDPVVPVYTIPSGLDFALFRLIPRDEARRPLGLPLDKRLVLWVGKPTNPRKRFPLAQRAMELLNQSLPAVFFVGSGLIDTYRSIIRNLSCVIVITSVTDGT